MKIRYSFLLSQAVAALAFLAIFSAHDSTIARDRSFIVEEVVFKTNVVPDSSNSEPVDIKAKFYLPKRAPLPISIVVIAPSSGGVEKVREIYYAKELMKNGIAALVVDSFSSRKLTNSLYDQSQLESWQVENDVIAALKYLKTDPRFQADHVGIMGVSKGGTVAMDTAFEVRRKWAGIKKLAFAAHIAISPDCNWTTRSDITTGAPIFFMLAERDDQTPIEACLAKAELMKKAGNKNIETKVYKGAHHAWEELGRRPFFDPKAENFSQCRVLIEDDGHMVAADTGKTIPEKDWYSWAKDNCVTLGVHCCGGTRKLKKRATRDIIAFLRKCGF